MMRKLSDRRSNAPTQKKYLSIGEVARQFDVSIMTLRKWEKDFPKVLHPYRTQGETRLYDEKAVSQVAMIHRLLKGEGMTIEGVRRKLSTHQDREENVQAVLGKLQTLRDEIMSIVGEIDKIHSQTLIK